ncbi:MAG TPA: hypothetical protein VNW28_07955, partial [Chthoniobacterales bacterium]|nr:hypothetical protein [Chthoniobacterales bacterium]
MIVERRAPPERLHGAGELISVEGGQDFLAGRKMERHLDVPGRHLGETFGQMSEPVTRVAVARTIADDEQAARRDARREPGEEPRLFVRRKIMQDVEEDDVTV